MATMTASGSIAEWRDFSVAVDFPPFRFPHLSGTAASPARLPKSGNSQNDPEAVVA